MGHEGLADIATEELGEIGAGEVEFDRDRFVFDQRTDAADEIESGFVGGGDGGSVGFAFDDGDFGSGTDFGTQGWGDEARRKRRGGRGGERFLDETAAGAEISLR